VLKWGVPAMRDLPWRAERDPWRILVSEVMLQQTQVERVIPKWHAFLTAFPTPADCAIASLGDVLRLWQGLGYPRRARNLQAAAAIVVELHNGQLPDDLDDLLDLPGIGPYTARAVLAFAFERDVAVVDTNIARVLARTLGERLTPKRAQERADAAVPDGQGWVWNQVVMDLGATLCRPTPTCIPCPLAGSCSWHLAGRPHPDPATGSSGVSGKQARFEGSARQARGKVLAAVGVEARPAADFDDSIIAGLVADGLVIVSDDTVHLPE
jgi:A/G-specific adenine glycosylase